MALCFIERSVSDIEKPGELAGTEATEPLGGIPGGGRTPNGNLIAIIRIPPHRSDRSKCKHFTLKFEGELPGNEILEAPNTHANGKSTIQATDP